MRRHLWIICRYFAALSPPSPGSAALLGWHRRPQSIITSPSQCRVTSAAHFSTGCLLIRGGKELWSGSGAITATSNARVARHGVEMDLARWRWGGRWLLKHGVNLKRLFWTALVIHRDETPISANLCVATLRWKNCKEPSAGRRHHLDNAPYQ